jgi:hypothetical protein
MMFCRLWFVIKKTIKIIIIIFLFKLTVIISWM